MRTQSDEAAAVAVNVYDDPVLYDVENADVAEVPMLLRLASATGGPILDLACGTGRTSLPLAKAGYAVTGVDLSEPMLARARAKATEAGLDVAFHLQDCQRLDLPLTARTVTMTGNAFQEFLSNAEQDALLRSVDRHLAPGGLFVFDTRFPSRANLDRPPGEQPWATATDDRARTVVSSVIWRWDAIAQVQDYEYVTRIANGSEPLEETRSLGRLRYTWPREMERLLDQHGFDLDAIHGDWAGSPLTAESRSMVVIARKRG